jgi:hypothetical protein
MTPTRRFCQELKHIALKLHVSKKGPQDEGKWPGVNFPKENANYPKYLDTNQLHCGDASNYKVLHEVWTTKMKRPGSPPLKVVVEDASHIAEPMAMSLFFWFPKIEPGGVFIMEDIIRPLDEPNLIRTDVLPRVMPQVMKDLHYCRTGLAFPLFGHYSNQFTVRCIFVSLNGMNSHLLNMTRNFLALLLIGRMLLNACSVMSSP